MQSDSNLYFFWDNHTSIDCNTNYVSAILNNITDKPVEMTLVGDIAMRQINNQTRGVDASTDVLSYPFEPFAQAPLGNIVINIELALKQSERLNHTLDDEIALLSIHGLLHLLGMDHESDHGEMRQKEQAYIIEFGLPQSLIERTLKE